MADTHDTTGLMTLPPVAYADYVLEDLMAWRQAGLKTALVTLTGIDGASPRPLGSQLAVAEDGRATGAITGGCAEPAMVRDALSAMARGQDHTERYGKGSRFYDIVLPCGSGIEVYFDVSLSTEALQDLIERRQRRQISVYTCAPGGVPFERPYLPKRRLVIMGRGHIVPCLAQFAQMNEFEVVVYSPDETTRKLCRPHARTEGLISPSAWDAGLLDPYTAFVSLFHDHDIEPDLLMAAIESPAFYLGALGSRRSQVLRLETLKNLGCDEAALSRIHGPVGLDIGAKTPPEIALSIMSEIIAAVRVPVV